MSKDYKVGYICDRLACGEHCPSLVTDYCTHTFDINHAVNFTKVADDQWAEVDERVIDFLEEAKNHVKKL